MDKTTSESLAAIVISNRILGLYSDEAKVCMSELLRRREDDGDSFEFEKYINDQIEIVNGLNDKSREGNGLINLISSLSSIGRMI
ncbi:hypothetical protein M0R72_01630 [Candidatus Pacearchaeota archaeon]|jgi:hypothetical protein|nr:hypothetical protein [Candidatus Pacearchaeota archaeon]